MQIAEHAENGKNFLDAAGLASTIAIIFGILPHITAVLTAIWAVLRIYQIVLEIRKHKGK